MPPRANLERGAADCVDSPADLRSGDVTEQLRVEKSGGTKKASQKGGSKKGRKKTSEPAVEKLTSRAHNTNQESKTVAPSAIQAPAAPTTTDPEAERGVGSYEQLMAQLLTLHRLGIMSNGSRSSAVASLAPPAPRAAQLPQPVEESGAADYVDHYGALMANLLARHRVLGAASADLPGTETNFVQQPDTATTRDPTGFGDAAVHATLLLNQSGHPQDSAAHSYSLIGELAQSLARSSVVETTEAKYNTVAPLSAVPAITDPERIFGSYEQLIADLLAMQRLGATMPNGSRSRTVSALITPSILAVKLPLTARDELAPQQSESGATEDNYGGFMADLLARHRALGAPADRSPPGDAGITKGVKASTKRRNRAKKASKRRGGFKAKVLGVKRKMGRVKPPAASDAAKTDLVQQTETSATVRETGAGTTAATESNGDPAPTSPAADLERDFGSYEQLMAHLLAVQRLGVCMPHGSRSRTVASLIKAATPPTPSLTESIAEAPRLREKSGAARAAKRKGSSRGAKKRFKKSEGLQKGHPSGAKSSVGKGATPKETAATV